MLIGILRNQNPDSVDKWEKACLNLGVEYKIIDFTSAFWIREIEKENFDFFVHRPPGDLDRYKRLFDERLLILSQELGRKIYPSYRETFIYENKKVLSYFLKAHKIPHPQTNIFYSFNESEEYISSSSFPFVAKSNIGAAGSGVQIIHTLSEAKKYKNKAFKGGGIKRRLGPNRITGTPKKWFKKAIKSPKYFMNKVKSYLELYKDSQVGYVIFQNYITHNFEWRVAKIGGSYFAYKKFKIEEKASGAKSLGFENPPLELLDFVRNIAVKCNITSAAFDVFPSKGSYLVNEIQTIFGHINDHILEVDGIPGRYLFQNGNWVFEEGDFNTNESYDLRLKHAIELFQENAK